MSDSLWPHGLQHARPPCPSPTPGVDSNSCPLSRWCHPTISSSVVPFSSCLQSFPASGSFQMCQFFLSGGQSIGVSASASVLPMNYSGLISFRMDCIGNKYIWHKFPSVQRMLVKASCPSTASHHVAFPRWKTSAGSSSADPKLVVFPLLCSSLQ